MKIVCSGCKEVLGEQRPFRDNSEIEAKCNACLAKEKEAARQAQQFPDPEKEREVTFENGWKGRISIAGKETEELSFWDIIVAGKKFSCSEKDRDEAEGYLNRLAEEEVDVTFFHSATIKLDQPLGDRRKKKTVEPTEEKKTQSINYNCTVRIPKKYVLSILKDKADRMDKIAEILAEGALRVYKEQQQKAAQSEDKLSMSGEGNKL